MKTIYPTNPFYNPERFGLEMIVIDEANLSYEYNTLVFWRTPTGEVYTARDSGCSCPIPFEGCEGKTLDEVLQGLERVGSFEQAEQIVKSWNTSGTYFNSEGHEVKKRRASQSEVNEMLETLSRWLS